ncbi:glutaredoxin family protein [Rossellomorea sp. AcN35-11]|nr:glutaredoxin family protein [Rossellomorea aquimaris]NMH68182.1 glutaredoxin family protein [Bacillus sp. RO3]WJV29995.1 glutaredoxin family protein [Rossellomorea sp. AcN35-11]
MLTLYTIDGCIRCHNAKKMLEYHGISYIEKNLFHERDAANELIHMLGEVRTPALKSGRSIWAGKELLQYLEEEGAYALKDRSSK